MVSGSVLITVACGTVTDLMDVHWGHNPAGTWGPKSVPQAGHCVALGMNRTWLNGASQIQQRGGDGAGDVNAGIIWPLPNWNGSAAGSKGALKSGQATLSVESAL